MSNRRHYTQSEREQWLARFDQHGSTAISFCKEHGLCYQTFLRWRRASRPHQPELPGAFIELDVPAPPAQPSRGEEIEFTFPSGLTLRIQSGPSHPQPS